MPIFYLTESLSHLCVCLRCFGCLRYNRCLGSSFLLRSCLGLRLLSLGSHVVDSLGRAFLCAHTAVLALLGIDERMVVLDGDSVELADLSALAAADAAVLACLESLGSLVSILALNNYLVLKRSDTDNVLRACCCASSASCAEFTCYYCYSVADLDSSEVACSRAVAEA